MGHPKSWKPPDCLSLTRTSCELQGPPGQRTELPNIRQRTATRCAHLRAIRGPALAPFTHVAKDSNTGW